MKRVAGLAFGAVLSMLFAHTHVADAGVPESVIVVATQDRYLPGDRTVSDPAMGVPTLEIEQGTKLSLLNGDAGTNHSLTSEDVWGDVPFFDSGAVEPQSLVPVVGAEDLPSGMYPFWCVVREDMTGMLLVRSRTEVPPIPDPWLPSVPDPSLPPTPDPWLPSVPDPTPPPAPPLGPIEGEAVVPVPSNVHPCYIMPPICPQWTSLTIQYRIASDGSRVCIWYGNYSNWGVCLP